MGSVVGGGVGGVTVLARTPKVADSLTSITVNLQNRAWGMAQGTRVAVETTTVKGMTAASPLLANPSTVPGLIDFTQGVVDPNNPPPASIPGVSGTITGFGIQSLYYQFTSDNEKRE